MVTVAFIFILLTMHSMVCTRAGFLLSLLVLVFAAIAENWDLLFVAFVTLHLIMLDHLPCKGIRSKEANNAYGALLSEMNYLVAADEQSALAASMRVLSKVETEEADEVLVGFSHFENETLKIIKRNITNK